MVCSPTITAAVGGAQGGVSLVIQDQNQGWIIESARFHGFNMVSCEVINGGKRTLLIGAYLPNSTLENLTYLEEALTRFRDQYPIVLGDLNVNIDQSQNY